MKKNNNGKTDAWLKFGHIFRLIETPYKTKDGTEKYGLFPFIKLTEFLGLDLEWNIVESPCPKCGRKHMIRFERMVSEKSDSFSPVDSIPIYQIESERSEETSKDIMAHLNNEKSKHSLGHCKKCGGNWFIFDIRELPFLIKIAPETKEDVMGEKGWPYQH